MKLNYQICLLLTLLFSLKSGAQQGLEGVIVERYYVSNEADSASSAIGGFLAPGSVTYRIYLDMKEGYRFYAAFGNNDHALKIKTSTRFFNNEHIGNRIPNVIPRRTLSRNTVLLDSWLSAGGAGEEYYGVQKQFDNGLETTNTEGQYLRNNDPSAGIPLFIQDGLVSSNGIPYPVIFGPDSFANVFYNRTIGNQLISNNGAWGCLGGALGLDSLGRNQILIAQLTTNGELSFSLNVQIGKKGEKPELYVAENPKEGEFVFPALIYDSGLPTLTVTKDKVSTKTQKKENTKPSLK